MDSTKDTLIEGKKTYKVAVPQGDHDIFFQFVSNVYTWEFNEDDRLIFRDGNQEIIGIFEERLYFVKIDEANE